MEQSRYILDIEEMIKISVYISVKEPIPILIFRINIPF